jgi:hypothetical protein
LRGKNAGHSAKLGQFDRKAFKASAEILFDNIFRYERPITESVQYALTMKNGSAEEKREMLMLEEQQKKPSEVRTSDHSKVQDSVPFVREENLQQLLDPSYATPDTGIIEALGGLLAPIEGEDYEELAFENKMKKKKKRRPR